MADRFEEDPPKPHSTSHPRGVLPTYLTRDAMTLCKASATIRDAYEIRLALYLASTRKMRFILAVRPGAKVEPKLRLHLETHGGAIEEQELTDCAVYVGHIKESGEEGDGWVLGDAAAFATFRASLRSGWCRQKLAIGSSLSGADLDTLASELAPETLAQTNIDEEPIRDALIALVHAAKTEGGTLFIQ